MSSLIKRPAASPASDSLPPVPAATPVEIALDRMEAINAQLTEAAARGGAGSGAQIVGLRYDFTTECGNLLLAMCEDERIFGNRDLFVEMQTALDGLRTRFSNHQLRWQGDRIEADCAGYREAARGLGEAVVAFVAEARSAIA